MLGLGDTVRPCVRVRFTQKPGIKNGKELAQGPAADSVFRMHGARHAYEALLRLPDRAAVFAETFQAADAGRRLLPLAGTLKHFTRNLPVMFFPGKLIPGLPVTGLVLGASSTVACVSRCRPENNTTREIRL